jgi:hypothetical protein
MGEVLDKLKVEAHGHRKAEVLGTLEAEVAGNHKAEARGIKGSGIGSTSLKGKVQIEILLCPPFPIDQMCHLINLKAISYK